MRAQISLEMLIYLSLSSFSILFAISSVMHYLPTLRDSLSYYQSFILISEINKASISYSNSSIYAFIPKGLCNSSDTGSELKTYFGSFYTSPNIRLKKPFCPDGTYANISIKMENGFAVVGRENESPN
jgi:hypothetical protein